MCRLSCLCYNLVAQWLNDVLVLRRLENYVSYSWYQEHHARTASVLQ